MRKKNGKIFNCKHCGSGFYRNLAYIVNTPNPLFCKMACRLAAIKAGTFQSGPPPGPRPWQMTGVWLNCVVCSTPFYRRKSYAARGINKTCGKPECKSKFFSGENNSYWGKEHTHEVREQLKKHRASRESSTPRPKPKYIPSAEIRAKLSEALRNRWQMNRDVMLSYFPAENKPRELQRYRRNFTRVQRRTFKAKDCAWCKSTDRLELDHIISVIAGGTNVKENCQTLCRSCNLWKSIFIDKPFYLATLAIKGGS